jgi:hypothetical protein
MFRWLGSTCVWLLARSFSEHDLQEGFQHLGDAAILSVSRRLSMNGSTIKMQIGE